MNQAEFNRQYHEAITKATLGVHAILISPTLTLKQKVEDVRTSTDMLADGIPMNRQTVYYDVMNAYNQLKPALDRLDLNP